MEVWMMRAATLMLAILSVGMSVPAGNATATTAPAHMMSYPGEGPQTGEFVPPEDGAPGRREGGGTR